MSEARAPHWQPDPLLARTPARSPSFVRMPWDENNAQAFGPWRLQDKSDPTAPQTEPAKSFSSTPTQGDAQVDQASAPDGAAQSLAPGASPPAADTPAGAAPEGLPEANAVGSAHAPVAVAVGAASEQQLQVARQQGYVLGIKDGLSKALHDLEAERQKEREAIRSLTIELRALAQNPQRFFEPLRRLALHLAEQLVRGELSVSGQAIDRLVKSCLDDLGSHDKAVVVTLHPDDLQRLQALQTEAQGDMRLDADPALLPGSVRVRAHDAEIQDLIDDRLEALARRLLGDPEAWLQKSTLLHPHEVQALPDDAPKRPWFSRPVDVQDTASKPARSVEDAAALQSSDASAPPGDQDDLPTAVVNTDSSTEAVADTSTDTIGPSDTASAPAADAIEPATSEPVQNPRGPVDLPPRSQAASSKASAETASAQADRKPDPEPSA